MKKNNIKKTIIFVFIFCILIVILLFFIILKNNSKLSEVDNETNMESYENALKEANEEFLEKKEIVPDNFNFLVRLYEGDVESSYIYSRIYQIVFETIPDIYNKFKDSDEEKIFNYYDENSENIFDELGIDNKEEFVKFVNVVCNLNNIEYDSSIFDIKTLQNNDRYSNLNLQINFKDENKIVFNLNIINKQEDGKPILKFLVQK